MMPNHEADAWQDCLKENDNVVEALKAYFECLKFGVGVEGVADKWMTYIDELFEEYEEKAENMLKQMKECRGMIEAFKPELKARKVKWSKRRG